MHTFRVPTILCNIPAGLVQHELTGVLVAALSQGGLLADTATFEAAAQAVLAVSAGPADASSAAVEALLADATIKRLLKGDADAGCGVLMAVLVAFQAAGLDLPVKLQEGLIKVWCAASNHAESACMHL